MRVSQAWIIARHDMRQFRQKRGILLGLVAFPLGIGVGFPLLIELILRSAGTAGSSAWLPGILDAFALWFVIGAVSLPTTIAAYSIVGEKISKSLEPLLSTPTTDGEILLGKSLAALIPSVLAMWAGGLLFQGIVDLETVGPFGYLYYPNATMAVVLLLAMPLAALVAVEASVVISSRATDVRAAQQYAGALILPFFLLYIAGELGLSLDAGHLLLVSAALGVVALGLYFASLRAFRREEILTRWK
jgi:ABC-2 type transport system permease protein